MSRKTGNKWYTNQCPSCGTIDKPCIICNNKHKNYSGKLDSDGNEYVICGCTEKKCYVDNPVWRKELNNES